MSLVDACHYATKDVILEDVINIDKELRKVGIENPLIAVAGLNPHNGDNGLFGREEIDEIEPAVKAAQEKESMQSDLARLTPYSTLENQVNLMQSFLYIMIRDTSLVRH